MTYPRLALTTAALPLLLGGCLAKTALDVATLPVKAAGKAVDLATTSQSEADEKRGRRLREHEERLGRLQRDRTKWAERCQRGDARACDRLDEVDRAIEAERARPY